MNKITVMVDDRCMKILSDLAEMNFREPGQQASFILKKYLVPARNKINFEPWWDKKT